MTDKIGREEIDQYRGKAYVTNTILNRQCIQVADFDISLIFLKFNGKTILM